MFSSAFLCLAFSASAQLIAVLDLLVRCDQHDAALAVCAEDKDLLHEIVDLPRREIDDGQHLLADQILRLIAVGYLRR